MSNSPFNDAQSVYQLPEALGKPYTVPQPEYISEMPEINMLAFSSDVARQICIRDKWTCRCGRGFRDTEGSYVVHASHKNHDKSNPEYDNPDTGECKCALCHLNEHIEIMQEEPSRDNIGAVRLLGGVIYKRGVHTEKYNLQYFGMIMRDRQEVIATFENSNLDPRDFIVF